MGKWRWMALVLSLGVSCGDDKGRPCSECEETGSQIERAAIEDMIPATEIEQICDTFEPYAYSDERKSQYQAACEKYSTCRDGCK